MFFFFLFFSFCRDIEQIIGLPGVGLVVAGVLLKPSSEIAVIEEQSTSKLPRFIISAAFLKIAIACSSVTARLNVRTKITIILSNFRDSEQIIRLPGIGLVVAGVLLKPFSEITVIEELSTLKLPRFIISAAFLKIAIACSSVTARLNVRTKITIIISDFRDSEQIIGLPGISLVGAGVLLKPFSEIAVIEELSTSKLPRFPVSAAFLKIAIACSSVTARLNVRTKITIKLPGLKFK